MRYMECNLPSYLQHDLEEFTKNPNDIWWCELYGSINSAEVDGEIPATKAWHLREKYLGLECPGRIYNCKGDDIMTLYYKHKDEITTKIVADFVKKTVEIENYSDFPLYCAFGVNKHPTIKDFEDFLEDRCFPRNCDGMKLRLRELDLDFYDPYQICRKTNGRLAGDFFSIEFEE